MNHTQEYFDKSANRKATYIWCTLCTILSLAYGVEIFKGLRTLNYYMAFLSFIWLPFIFGMLTLKIKGFGAHCFRSVLCWGYGISYTFALLTTSSSLCFVYILPLTSMLILFKDKHYLMRVGMGATIVTLISIIKNLLLGHTASADVTSYEIQFACIVLCFIGYNMSIDHLITVDNAMMQNIKNNLDTVVTTVKQVKIASGKIVDGMTVVRDLTDDNIYGANQVVSSMTDLSDSNKVLHDKTNSSQDMTQTINTQVQNVAQLIAIMVQLVNESSNHAGTSRNELEEVVKLTHQMSDLSGQVETAINEFVQVFTQVKNEISTIDGITTQTNLLALNASIEAARAGDAGKGFAVVAEEIRKLSNITKDSSSSIFHSLQSLEQTSDKVIESVTQITQSITDSLEKVGQVNTSVTEIAADTDRLGENIHTIHSAMNEVEVSNAKMVTNMKDIADIMDQSTLKVHGAEQTAKDMVSKYKQTSDNVQDIENIVGDLVKDLGEDGFMKLEDLTPGLAIEIGVKDTTTSETHYYSSTIEQILKDGILIQPLINNDQLLSFKNKSLEISVQVVYRNTVYMWEHVHIVLKNLHNTTYHCLVLKDNPKATNRRKYPRLAIQNSCSVQLTDHDQPINVAMKNISANGFCFTTPSDLFKTKKGQTIYLALEHFSVPNLGTLTGEILRVTECDGYYTIGGRLSKDYKSINTYVHKMLGE